MIAALDVHELLNKIHGILDNAVSKWVDSTSRQHLEVWAS